MKKILLAAVALATTTSIFAGEPEKYEAITFDGTVWVAAPAFAKAVVVDNKSEVKFGTTNVEGYALGTATPNNIMQDKPGASFPGWQEWSEVKWETKNQGDINFGYIQGTGVPGVELGYEEILEGEDKTGNYRYKYTYYAPDGSLGTPKMGLYYKLTPKVDGVLKVQIWTNKGNRKFYCVDEATKLPVTIKPEGYINGQNLDGKKKYLSSEEIQAIHDAKKVVDGVDTDPYVIGDGNNAYWGWVVFDAKAGQSYLLFCENAQVGFGGYEFTAGTGTGIENVEAVEAGKVAPKKVFKNGQIMIGDFNIAGQRVK